MQLRDGPEFRWLDFDIETRKVGFHVGGRFNPDGCEPVVIACAWDNDPVRLWSLGARWTAISARRMLVGFRELYEQADGVTGHYIRKFDLPILNGAMLEAGLPPLSPKLTLDTKLDLLNVAGLSQSQENLGSLRELEESKFHMNDNWWRKVARLTPEGLDLARTRVTADVRQHQAIRAAFQDWFDSPKTWRP